MKKIYIIFIALIASYYSMCASTRIGDLYYELDKNNKTAIVTYQYHISSGNYGYLTDVVVPDSITYSGVKYAVIGIGSYAFYNAQGMKSIEIPVGVTTIYGNAFNSSGLTSIILPDGLLDIKSEAFASCHSLTTVSIPSSVQSVGNKIFWLCWKAISIYYRGSLEEWCKKNWSANGASSLYINDELLTSVVIPESITEIKNSAFNYRQIQSVTFHDKITSIGEYAFAGTSITSIDIPNSVNTIGAEAFSGCTELTAVSLGSGITNIENSHFLNCPISRLTVLAEFPPAGGSNSGIPNTSCKLFVPGESLDVYSNTEWWKDFAEIRAIGSMPIVKFVDWDGTVLSSVEVEKGKAATAATNPTREGYTFIGWDKDFSNVTEDMVVTALYKINRYKVDFVDWNYTLLKSDSVDWNTAAIAPAIPYRKGYTFTGWNKNYEHITSDETIMAQYEMGEEKDVTVLYTNGNNGNTILSHSIVLKMPEAPEIDGFTFLGWQPKAELINDRIEIQAIYKSDSEAAPQVVANPSNPSQKLIRNGNVYILTGNKTYTITGAEVK